MTANILTAIIAAFGAVMAAVLTYWFTKEKEREADWRKEKIAHYKAFIDSISGIIEGDATDEGHMAFARATTSLLLIAPQSVLEALYEYRDHNAISNANRSYEHHDKLLAKLIAEIRKDVNIKLKDDLITFRPRLYSSGVKKK